MQTNIVKITRNNANLSKILDEAQKTAVYAELDVKQTFKVTLIAEELVGMLNELSENFEGTFYIEANNRSFKFVTQISLNENMDKQTKRKFIDISSEKKNASAKGIMGKIRDVVENMLYPENALYSSNFVAYQLETAVLLDDTWTLNRYKDSQRENEEAWDELEKSIIANLADDVIVSVKGTNVEIVIMKTFGSAN